MSDQLNEPPAPPEEGDEDRLAGQRGDRFGDYIRLYNNIDRILWTVPALLLTLALVALGIVSQNVGKPAVRIPPLSHETSMAGFFVLLSLIYGLGAYTLYRIRKHHNLLGQRLRALELNEGYFHDRERLRGAVWREDVFWFGLLFVLMSLAFLGMGAYHLRHTPTSPSPLGPTFSDGSDFPEGSIKTTHGTQEKERAFRVEPRVGSNYTWIEAGDDGSWQRSHLHRRLHETYIVQRGWIAVAEKRSEQLEIRLCWPGDVATVQPCTPHNVYLPAKAAVHVVRHGSVGEGMAELSPPLEVDTVKLSEKDLLERGNRSCSRR